MRVMADTECVTIIIVDHSYQKFNYSKLTLKTLHFLILTQRKGRVIDVSSKTINGIINFWLLGLQPDTPLGHLPSTMHLIRLICPPKFCITFVFHFPWVLHHAKFWGQLRCIMGDKQGAFSKFSEPLMS